MALLGFLILFPAAVGVVLFLVRDNMARKVIVAIAATVIALTSLWMVLTNLGTEGQLYEFSSVAVDLICTLISVVIAIVIIYHGVRYKNVAACVLAVVQLVLSLVFDFAVAPGVEVVYGFYVDSLTLLMTFIIGVIGSGICVYALGYMDDFQAHLPEFVVDRRPRFFGLMFVFLSAMFLIVFSNNMVWLFTGWEITTVCSFLLIGYTRTEEAIKNSFRQIIMNLIGGISFVVALYLSALFVGTLSFQSFIDIGISNSELVALAACAFVLAGCTKAAQMPFHTWLLGAMVAPTPTSALLHSSTMVKAGVYLLIRIAPVLEYCVSASTMAILVGGVTFMVCSFMAISQSNAKRVLAYSTIANLGLIVACAGVGSPEAVWAACLLMLYHAIAKSLLFLCVGTAEHHIGSRNIEDMDLLFERMPRLARFMMLGIMIMFIAPFGMLISKWGTLVSIVDSGQVILLLLLAFGSGATFMFWAKWLGKLSAIAGQPQNVEETVHKSEWAALLLMVILAVLACVFLPLISTYLVEPYVYGVYGTLGEDIAASSLWLAAILSVFVVIILFVGLGRGSKSKKATVYLSGASADNEARVFRDSMSGEMEATSRNLYLDEIFGEERWRPLGEWTCLFIIILSFILGIVVQLSVL